VRPAHGDRLRYVRVTKVPKHARRKLGASPNTACVCKRGRETKRTPPARRFKDATCPAPQLAASPCVTIVFSSSTGTVMSPLPCGVTTGCIQYSCSRKALCMYIIMPADGRTEPDKRQRWTESGKGSHRRKCTAKRKKGNVRTQCRISNCGAPRKETAVTRSGETGAGSTAELAKGLSAHQGRVGEIRLRPRA